MLALVTQPTATRLVQANTVIYALAQQKYSTVFHDVTTGNISVVCSTGSLNCGSNGFLTGYDAGAGYDLASGLGSVDVAQLVNNWSTVALTPTSTSLQINSSRAPVTATHGTSLDFNVAVTPGAAGGNVSIIDNANGTDIKMYASNSQTYFPLSNGTVSATYNGLPSGSYTIYGYYGGDATHAASQSNGIEVNISAEGSTTALGNGYHAVSNMVSTSVVSP
jgi:hypothetical protein